MGLHVEDLLYFGICPAGGSGVAVTFNLSEEMEP